MGKLTINLHEDRILKEAINAYCLLLLTGLLLLPALSVNAQETTKQISIMMGSPEAAQLAKYGNLDVSMYKGVPDISVPIYTIQLKDFEMPISLSYDAGGIKVDQIATSVGLGWSLIAGGQITAASYALSDYNNPPRRPDNLQAFNPNVWGPFSGTSSQLEQYLFAWRIFSGGMGLPGTPKNIKPDIFYVQYPGYNGKFVIDGKVRSFFSAYSVPYENHDISYGNGFKIIDDRGNIFIFNELEISTTSTFCTGGVGPAMAPTTISSSMIPRQAYTWHLSKIITANKDTLTFSYENAGSYNYEDKKVQQKYVGLSNSPQCPYDESSDLYCDVKKTVSPLLLNKIEHSRSGLEIIFDYWGTRQDFGGGQFPMLQQIFVRKNGIAIKSYSLTHSYFTSGGGEGERYKRLKLESVQQTGMPAYTFEYDPGNLPHRGSYAQDVWGFYNGQNGNQTLVPERGGLTQAANRQVNTAYVGHWTMNKISYPTGGSTVINMEGDPAGGGLRVKSIKDLNGMGQTIGLRTFSYERVTYNSPVFIDDYHYWAQPEGYSYYVGCNYTMVTATTIPPVATMNGPDYGYSKVTVDYETGGQKGRMVAEYSTPFSTRFNAIAWGRGQLLSKIWYRYSGGAFTPVKKVTQTYKNYHDFNGYAGMWTSSDYPHEHFIYGLDIQLRWPEFREYAQISEPARFDVTKFRIVSAWRHPDSTYVYLYDPDGSTNNTLTTTTKQIFYTSSTRLKEVHKTNSDGTKKVITYAYASDEYPGFDKGDALYSVTISNGASNVLRKHWILWDNSEGWWAPASKWIWEGGNPSQPVFTNN